MPHTPSPERPSILVVDDDPGMLSLAYLLLAEDWDLKTAMTRDGALRLLGEADFRVLVADLHLPDGSGLDVLRAARQRLPDLEGILMTGHTTVETATSAVELGLHAYMSKPFQTDELDRMVRAALEKSQYRRRLREKNEELERANAELSAALEQIRTAQQAQIEHERLASIGMIAAGIAHEINNPAAFVAANVEMLDSRVRRLFDLATRPGTDAAGRADAEATLAEILEMRADTLEGVSRIVSITRDLKTFGRKEDRKQLTDVNAVVASVLRICGHHVRRHARVSEDLGDVPRVWASPESLNQVFLNLLINAAQACETAGDHRSIAVRTYEAGGRVRVEVTDDAGGIPDAVVERIWEPFFTTKPKGVGTGLGLAIVRRIVADHGGDIRLATAVGTGTAFTVELPPAAEELAPIVALQPAAPAQAAAPGRRILVVDDEQGIQRALRAALSPEYDVWVASDGTAALAMLERGTPDLILSDLYMTPMGGAELLAEATRRDPALATRFLFMSGSPTMSRTLPAATRPTVLQKPFSIPDLRRAIEAAFHAIEPRPERSCA
jgi:signal transduction histidine kinase